MGIQSSAPNVVYMVFEYLDFDLAGILQHPKTQFTLAHCKTIIQQLLQALQYIHHLGIVHRDLKGSNVLLSRRGGIIKLADFGLAKTFIKEETALMASLLQDDCDASEEECSRMMTNRVITLWYRPPEILLGATKYGPEVDIWGVGCILLELLSGKPIFTGQDELSQLEAITRRLGPLRTGEQYPWLQMMNDAMVNKGEPHSPSSPAFNDENYIQDEFGDRLGEGGVDLVRQMLHLDPEQRISATKALEHPWFTSEPLPMSLEPLVESIEGDWHDFESRKRPKSLKWRPE